MAQTLIGRFTTWLELRLNLETIQHVAVNEYRYVLGNLLSGQSQLGQPKTCYKGTCQLNETQAL